MRRLIVIDDTADARARNFGIVRNAIARCIKAPTCGKQRAAICIVERERIRRRQTWPRDKSDRQDSRQ